MLTRAALDDVRDGLFVLEAAVADVERDLEQAGDDPREVREALEWLLEASRQLLATSERRL